jgi:methionyl-tRNA synthetase
MALTDAVNEYVDANKPWDLAKQEGQDARLHEVCSELINAFRILSVYLARCCRKWRASRRIFESAATGVGRRRKTPCRRPQHQQIQHLMQRVEQQQVDNLIEANKQSRGRRRSREEKAAKPRFRACGRAGKFDDFMKIDMRVAKVLNCEAVEGSSKLLKFSLDLGFEERTIFSGIAASYPEPEKLIGRMVIVVANFAPRKMAKFGVSEGMILSAATADGKLKLLDVDAGAAPGDKVG